MKRVLITGSGSYIGNSVRDYLSQWPSDYLVDELDMQGDAWKQASFTGYDSVFHVAGIAHQDLGKISKEREALYFAVNTDLAVAVAKKAKESGVKQFIFMSSMSVYLGKSSIKYPVTINRSTKPNPVGAYGKSKLKAENILKSLQEEQFYVCILRPPMIYGKGCKGNYPLLSKLARTSPIFPNLTNERSMLYMGNLCTFVKHMIDDETSGVFFPQNAEYVSTSNMVSTISAIHGKTIRLTPIANGFLRYLSGSLDLVDKIFGSLVYEAGISAYIKPYQLTDFYTSILETEKQ